MWLTSAWSCVTHTGAVGEEQSCYRLCAYDDYCARQVSCAAPDIDLLLCTLGVCLPEAPTAVVIGNQPAHIEGRGTAPGRRQLAWAS